MKTKYSNSDFVWQKKTGNDLIYAIDYHEVPIRFDLLQSKLEKSKVFSFAAYKAKVTELSDYMNFYLEPKKTGGNFTALEFTKTISPKQRFVYFFTESYEPIARFFWSGFSCRLI